MNVETKARLTFPGGTHPADSKELTSEIAISPGPVPKQVTLMLSQHIGAPCKPLVEKGDEVQVGQMIGDSDAFVSAPVHSSVNGKVKEVTLQPHVIMGRSPGIVIDPDPENNPQRTPVHEQFTSDFDSDKYSAEQICMTLREAGLVGMGGAGFPTRVKVEPNPEMPKETMIINGCECEPYITCDYRIMLEWTDQIIAGIKLAKKASGCSRVFIGIEDNKPRAIEVMTAALAKHKGTQGIEVVPVRTKYPQGGERQLIRSILKKNVPTGGIPPMIGVLVLNTATVAAIAEAVVCDHPLTHRVVTVTGEAIARPGNFYVPIGISAQELIEFCGGANDESAKVIMGGPMMGIAIADLSTPTTKATGSILVLTDEQIGKAKSEQRQTPCIRCGRCLQACPEHLNPTKIAHAVKCDMLDVAQDYYMNACIECGCCSYVCPANIEITGHIKTGKILLARRKKLMPE
jgi:electron transport complex protein RnfC